MPVIYNVISRRKGILYLVAPNGEKCEVNVGECHRGIRAKYQVKFKRDEVYVENMMYRSNENDKWCSYTRIADVGKHATPIKNRARSNSGATPAKFQFI